MAAQVFSGLSIGLLLGLLVGLSTSPVVALVVGAIAAMLSTLVLPYAKGSANDPTPARQQAAAYRSGALGVAATVGLVSGIWMRTHDALSPPAATPPTLAQQVAAVQAAGFSAVEARHLVASRELAGTRVAPASVDASPKVTDPHGTVLFGVDAETCERMVPSRYKDVATAAAAYDAVGLTALASCARSLQRELPDDGQRKVALVAAVGALCAAR